MGTIIAFFGILGIGLAVVGLRQLGDRLMVWRRGLRFSTLVHRWVPVGATRKSARIPGQRIARKYHPAVRVRLPDGTEREVTLRNQMTSYTRKRHDPAVPIAVLVDPSDPRRAWKASVVPLVAPWVTCLAVGVLLTCLALGMYFGRPPVGN
jgi:hypothetical protein